MIAIETSPVETKTTVEGPLISVIVLACVFRCMPSTFGHFYIEAPIVCAQLEKISNTTIDVYLQIRKSRGRAAKGRRTDTRMKMSSGIEDQPLKVTDIDYEAYDMIVPGCRGQGTNKYSEPLLVSSFFFFFESWLNVLKLYLGLDLAPRQPVANHLLFIKQILS